MADITGTVGNDVLPGNATEADVVSALEGNDTSWAGGADTFDDLTVLGAGDDIGGVAGGNDTIIGDGHDGATDLGTGSDDGADSVYGGAGDDLVIGGSYSNDGTDATLAAAVTGSLDAFITGTMDDVAYGGDGNDAVLGAGGNDELGGGAGADYISGGAGNDVIYAGAGDDADTLNGGEGNDTIYNGGGADIVDGGAGDDEIWGGAGDDTLTTGAGADLVGFVAGNGNDTVTDFTLGDDVLDLQAFSGSFADAAAVLAAMADSGAGVVLTLDGTTSVTFTGLTVADFEAATADAWVNLSGTAEASPAGGSFALTTGVDDIAGGAGNDTVTAIYDATDDTTSLLDTVDLGAGTSDTANIIVGAQVISGATGPVFENVEVVNLDVRSAQNHTDFSTVFADATSLSIEGDYTVNVAGIDFDQTSVSLADNVDEQVTLSGSTAATGDENVALTLNGNAITTGLSVTDTDNNATDLDLTIAGNSSIADITAGGAAMTDINVTANADLTIADISDAQITDLSITGASNVTVTANTGGAIDTVAASAATGNISIQDLDGGLALSVALGSGDDTVDVSALGANDTLSGGEGTDTLSMELDNGEAAFTGATITGFEALELTTDGGGADAISANFDGFEDITSVTMTSTGVADTLTVTNAGAQTYEVNGTVALDNLSITLADATGASDAITITVASDDDTTATTLDDFDATGVETVNLVLTAEQEITGNEVLINEVSTATAALVISGNADAELGGGTTLTNTSINASAATGDLTFNLGTADQSVTGGAGDDTFDFGANMTGADTVDGGDGDDTVAATVDSTAGDTTVTLAELSNVETVEIAVTQDAAAGETATIDAENLASGELVVTHSGANAANDDTTAVTNLQEGVGLTLEGDITNASGTNDIFVTAALETATGTADTLTVTLDANTAAQTIDGLATTAIEVITLSVDDGETAAQTTTIGDLDISGATGLVVSGADNLIVTTFTSADDVTSVNLSGLTGAFDLATTAGGATYTLGTIADGANGSNIDTDQLGGNNAGAGNDDAFSAITLHASERDTIVFSDLSNSIVINGMEAGGDVTDDDIDLSALGVTFADLTFTDGDWDDDGTDGVRVSSTEFDGDIYLTNLDINDLNQNDFIF
jgi:RTX calcium-binding nonapeptide repeat (4 copies)